MRCGLNRSVRSQDPLSGRGWAASSLSRRSTLWTAARIYRERPAASHPRISGRFAAAALPSRICQRILTQTSQGAVTACGPRIPGDCAAAAVQPGGIRPSARARSCYGPAPRPRRRGHWRQAAPPVPARRRRGSVGSRPAGRPLLTPRQPGEWRWGGLAMRLGEIDPDTCTQPR